MTGLHLWQYPLVLFACLALVLVLTPLSLRIAQRFQVFDHPSDIKAQASPIPYLGGAAIVVGFAVVVLVAAVLRPPVSGLRELGALLAIAVGLAVMGLLDDLRGLGPWVRLALEIAAGAGVWATGTTTKILPTRPADAVLTVVWVVGVTNAYNLLDNMDGLSAGVATISAISLGIVAYLNGQFLVAALAAALAGCAAGFLRDNFHPARIYMGDAGSLFLGFLLAVLALRLRTHTSTQITFFVPVLVLGVALFDTALVTTTRLIHHRSPMSGGRDHTSHRLVFVGLPVPAAVSLIYAVAIALGWLAVVVSRVDRTTSFILMGLVLTTAGFLGTLLALVPVYETSRRRRMMLQEVREHEVEAVAPGHASQESGVKV